VIGSKGCRWPAAAGFGLAAIFISGCTQPAPNTSGGDVQRLLLSQAPAGYRLRVDTSLPLDKVAAATPADPAASTAQLRSDGFLGGWSRVWTSGDDDVEVVAMELGDQFRAADFVRFQLGQLAQGAGVVTYAAGGIPGATAFSLSGNTRARRRQVFCQGVWLTVGQYAFEITDCAGAPRYPDLALKTARQQYHVAANALGVNGP